MQSPEAGGSIKEIRDLRSRVAKLEQINRKLTKSQDSDSKLDRAWIEWQRTFDTIEDLIIVIDNKFEIIQANPAVSNFTGKPLKKIIGKTCCQVIHDTKKPAERCPLKKAQSSKKCEEVELYISEKNLWIEVFVNPILDDQGDIYRVIHVIRDITERKKNRDALVESERRFRSIFDNANDVIVSVTKFGKILEVNAKVKHALGYDPDDLIGKNFLTSGILSVRNAAAIVKSFKEAVDVNGFPHKQDLDITEVWLNHKDGRTILFEASTTAIRKNGKLEGFLSILRDVTGPRKAQEAYRSLVDHSLQGLAIFQDGHIVFANEAMVKITGYSVDEMLALPREKVQAFVHPEDRELVWNRNKQRLEGKLLPERYEFRGLRKDGSVCWLEIDASLAEYQGKPAIQAAYLDITELKKVGQLEQEYIRQLQYLSESATEFVKLTPDQDIYALIAKKIKELCEDSIVAVNTFDEVSDSLCVCSVVGLGKYTQAVTQIMGTNPVGQYFPLDDDAKEGLGQGKLLKIPNGIYDLSPGIPRIVCQAIEKLLGLSDVYAMGLNSEGRLYGSVTIFTRSNKSLKNHELIETFMNQAAVAIRRRESDLALRRSEEKFKKIFDQSPMAIEIYDSDGLLIDANAECLKLFGVKCFNDVKGFQLFNDPNLPGDAKKKLIQGNVIHYESEFNFNLIKEKGFYETSKSGQAFLNVHITPLCDSDDKVSGYLVQVEDITERKKAEQALRESENRFRGLTTSAPVGIFQTDSEGNSVYVNKTVCSFTGLRTEQHDGTGWTTALHPDDRDRVFKLWTETVAGNATFETEFRFIDTKKEVTWLASQAEKLEDEDGNVTGFIGTLTDITELKRSEEALRESRENYRIVSEMTSDYIAKVRVEPDGELVLVAATDRLENNTGYALDELRDQDSWSKIVHPDDYDRFEDFWKKIISSKESCELLFRGIDREQQFEWLHAIGKPILDEKDEHVISIIFAAKDITERKEAEDALKESELKFRLVTETIEDVFWMSTPGIQKMVYISPSYETIWGRSCKSLYEAPMSFMEVVHPEDRAQISSIVEKYHALGKSYRCEYRIVPSDGRLLWISERGFPVLDEYGKVRYMTGVCTDITQRKKVEEDLRKSEEKYRMLFEHAGDYILLLEILPEAPPIIRDANFFALEKHGYTREELVDKPITFLDTDKSKTKIKERLQLVLQKKEAQFEVEHRCKDGSVFTAEASVKLFKSGSKNFAIAIERDITKRKKAEQALRVSENRLALAIECTGMGLWDRDFKTDRVTRNDTWMTMLGYRPDEIAPDFKSFLKLIHPDDISDFNKCADTHTKNLTPVFDQEHRMRTKSGEWRWIRNFGRIVSRDEQGRPLRAVGLHLDVTDRKKAEEDQKEHKRELTIRNRIANIFLTVSDDRMYGKVLNVILDAMDSEFGTFGYFNEDGNFVRPAIIREACWEKCNVPDKEILFEKGQFTGIWSNAVKQKKTLIVNEGPFNISLGHDPIKNMMVAPIILNNKVIGAIHIVNKSEGYDEKDRLLLNNIAAHIAPILNARLQRDQEQKQRKKAEEAYRSLVDHSLQGLVIFKERRVVFANQAMAQITGYSIDEMLSSPPEKVQAFVHPDDRELVWNRHKQRLQGKFLPERYEIRGIRKDGSVRWLEIDACLVEFQGKQAIQATYIDITKRKNAEEKLRQEAQTRSILIDNLPCIAVILKKSTREIVASNEAARKVGAIPGKTCYGTCAERDEPCPFCLAPEVWATNELRRLEVESNGKYYEGIWVPLTQDLYVHYIFDITERKKAEQALRTSENRLALAIECTGMGLWDQDFQTGKITRNENWVTMLGYRPDEIGPDFKSFLELIHSDDIADFKKYADAHKAGLTTVFDLEHRMRAKSGEWRWVRNFGRIVTRDELGRPLRAVGVHLDVTERKKAEEELKESEHRFKTLFECAPDGFYLTDLKGNFVEGNKAAEKMIGYKKEELINSNFIEAGLLPPEQIPKAMACLEKNFNGEPTGPDEFTLICKDRSHVSVEIRTFPVRIGNQNLVLGIARDITKRQKAEEALADNERRLKLTIDSAGLGIWDWDLVNEKLIWAGEHARLFGFNPDQFDGSYEAFKSRIHPDDWLGLSEAIERSLKDGSDYSHEYRVVWPDDSIHWIRGRGRPLLDQNGKAIRMYGVVYDITKRRKAEEQIKAERDRAQSYLNLAGVIFVALGSDQTVTMVNPKCCEILGYDADEIIGRNWFDTFIPKQEQDRVKQSFASLIRGELKPVEYFENPVVTKSGEERLIAWNNTLLCDTDSNITGTLSSGEDITEKKMTENQLYEYQAKLKAMATETLRAEEHERRRIAIGLHDDICQKLVISKFMLESSLKSLTDDKLSKSLRIVSEAIGETICQAESLTFKLSNPILREFGLVAALEKYLDEEIKKKYGISYKIVSDKKLGAFNDEIKTFMFRIVRELLTNVVKHAQASKISVSVRKHNKNICIEIKDDGIGFETSNAVSQTRKSTRFGLFSVREQLDHLGGNLSIESKSGCGTTAKVIVPLEQ